MVVYKHFSPFTIVCICKTYRVCSAWLLLVLQGLGAQLLGSGYLQAATSELQLLRLTRIAEKLSHEDCGWLFLRTNILGWPPIWIMFVACHATKNTAVRPEIAPMPSIASSNWMKALLGAPTRTPLICHPLIFHTWQWNSVFICAPIYNICLYVKKLSVRL